MITICGTTIKDDKKFEKQKKWIHDYVDHDLRFIKGLIVKVYLDNKRKEIISGFEKNTIDYYRDLLVIKYNEFNDKQVSWYKNKNHNNFLNALAEWVYDIGGLKTAYNQTKNWKIKKTGFECSFLSIIFENKKNTIIFKKDERFFLCPSLLYRIEEKLSKTKDAYVYYSYFDDMKDIYSLFRTNKTTIIENIITNKLNVNIKDIKSQ